MFGILAGILESVLTWLVLKLGTLLGKQVKREENKTAAKKSVKPLEDAKTPGEVDDATHDALDGF